MDNEVKRKSRREFLKAKFSRHRRLLSLHTYPDSERSLGCE